MQLQVSLFEKPCGILSIEDERFSFRYLEAYIKIGGPPVSIIMPVSETVFPDKLVFPFFENLLPEGRLRLALAKRFKTAENNFARLLAETGGEVAGAISIFRPDEKQGSASLKKAGNKTSQSPTSTASKPLTPKQFGVLIKRMERTPFLAEPNGSLRLSLAGTQNKLPVILEGGRIRLPEDSLSTHIIKPPSDRFANLVQNEYLCMRTAAAAGLDVPEVQLIPYKDADGIEMECLAIKRYDRMEQGKKYRRLHQEDLCQILAIPSAQKYVMDGGPGYSELFECTRQYTRPYAVHQNQLVQRMIFNLLIGNHDAHGKNFSFLHRNSSLVLAPAYDLLCTNVYEDLNQDFAMPLGSALNIKQLKRESLEQFAQETGVNLIRQARQIKEFIRKVEVSLTEQAKLLEQKPRSGMKKLFSGMARVFNANKQHLEKLFP